MESVAVIDGQHDGRPAFDRPKVVPGERTVSFRQNSRLAPVDGISLDEPGLSPMSSTTIASLGSTVETNGVFPDRRLSAGAVTHRTPLAPFRESYEHDSHADVSHRGDQVTVALLGGQFVDVVLGGGRLPRYRGVRGSVYCHNVKISLGIVLFEAGDINHIALYTIRIMEVETMRGLAGL